MSRGRQSLGVQASESVRLDSTHPDISCDLHPQTLLLPARTLTGTLEKFSLNGDWWAVAQLMIRYPDYHTGGWFEIDQHRVTSKGKTYAYWRLRRRWREYKAPGKFVQRSKFIAYLGRI